ncbi:hypothetical protein PM082_020149 [Marasmius tenuissimus]|nr:hypothetical protein PM082_020149 [Marasmius tenuissimus]
MLYALIIFSLTLFIPGAVVVVLGIVTRRDESTLPPQYGDIPECRIMVSNVKNGYIATYVLLILYEAGEDLESDPRQNNELEKDYSFKYTSTTDGYSLA